MPLFTGTYTKRDFILFTDPNQCTDINLGHFANSLIVEIEKDNKWMKAYVGLIFDLFTTDQQILRELERKKILVFTPSRRVAGKRVVCYDDRFIVKLAYDVDGIIVSNDTYRDLQGEKPEWKRFIEERLLMYSFVNDK